MSIENKETIKDLLFDGFSIAQISKTVLLSEKDVRRYISANGLDWLIAKNRKTSKGHKAILDLFRELIPGYETITEYHIGDRLYLDVYCPRLNIAAEYHGRQHYEFVSRFHNTIDDFKRGVANDERKIAKCNELGITLVSFAYNEDLTLNSVSAKLIAALKDSENSLTTGSKNTNLSAQNEYYQKAKAYRNEQRRKLYRELKKGKTKT